MNSAATFTLSQLADLKFPPQEHIISHGILHKRSKLVVAGAPKSLKSFATNTMAVQLLIGGNLFGVHSIHSRMRENYFHIEPVERVLIIEQELGLHDNQGRFVPLFDSLTQDERGIVGKGLFIRSCDYELRFDGKGREKLHNVIMEVKPQVVIFDPFIKFHSADENDPSEMNGIMRGLSQMQHALDFALVLIHHINKSEEKSGLDLLRGGSSIAADLDTCMLIHSQNRAAGLIRVETILKRGKPIEEYVLRLNDETLRMEFYSWYQTYAKEVVKATKAKAAIVN